MTRFEHTCVVEGYLPSKVCAQHPIKVGSYFQVQSVVAKPIPGVPTKIELVFTMDDELTPRQPNVEQFCKHCLRPKSEHHTLSSGPDGDIDVWLCDDTEFEKLTVSRPIVIGEHVLVIEHIKVPVTEEYSTDLHGKVGQVYSQDGHRWLVAFDLALYRLESESIIVVDLPSKK